MRSCSHAIGLELSVVIIVNVCTCSPSEAGGKWQSKSKGMSRTWWLRGGELPSLLTGVDIKEPRHEHDSIPCQVQVVGLLVAAPALLLPLLECEVGWD